MYGHKGIVKILLGRGDVNPDSARQDGQTPLWWAAENGHEMVVKQLLEWNDVNSDTRDKHGRTRVLQAVVKGHKIIAGLLSEPADSAPRHVASL